MMYGHDYCSYMCKRVTGPADTDQQSPVERMEIQANTFPRYFLILEKTGKDRATRLLAYYGGIRNLETMQHMVNDLAEYYGTTKTIARSRLMDFGYNEARGILRTVNGNLVPSYFSTRSENRKTNKRMKFIDHLQTGGKSVLDSATVAVLFFLCIRLPSLRDWACSRNRTPVSAGPVLPVSPL